MLRQAPSWIVTLAHCSILAVFPGLLFFLNPNWCHQGLGHMDTWYYFGAFHHFPRYHNLSPSYSLERIAWVAPGYALTHWFGAATAPAVLHSCVFVSILLCVYWLVRQLAGASNGFLAAALLGGHPCFIGSNGWDYPESLPMLFFAATLALIAKARSSTDRRYLWTFAAAVACFAMLYTFLAWAAFLPIVYVLCIWAVFPVDGLKRGILQVAVVMLVAGIVTTGVFEAIYCFMGAHGFFYTATIAQTIQQFFISSNPWMDPNWYRECTWLVVPSLALVAAIWTVLTSRRHVSSQLAGHTAFQWGYVSVLAVMIVLTINKNRLLVFDYDASILMPLAFTVLTLGFMRIPAHTPPAVRYAVTAFAAVLSMLPLAKPDSYKIMRHWWLILPLLAVFFAGVVFRNKRPATLWSGSVLAFALIGSTLTPGYPSGAWRGSDDARAATKRISQSIAYIDSKMPAGRRPVFWFVNETGPLAGEFRGIMCSYMAHSNSMTHFPKVEGSTYHPGDRIYVISAAREDLPVAHANLLAAGYEIRPGAEHRIRGDGVDYWLFEIELMSAPALVNH